jgi:uncharacterized protein YndB with AHSA1/START domain
MQPEEARLRSGLLRVVHRRLEPDLGPGKRNDRAVVRIEWHLPSECPRSRLAHTSEFEERYLLTDAAPWGRESDVDVHRSIGIEATPERVWPLLVEPDNVLRWCTTLRAFRYMDERRGPGAHVHMEERAVGPMLKIDFEATEWVENRLLAFHMTSGSGVKAYDQRWSLEPAGTGCRFTFDEHVELPLGPLGRLLGAVGKRTSEGHVADMLASLKGLAEA